MASELSQLIESELRKAEGANKPDEHQRRLASLRVKTGLEKPPPGIFQRFCTPKRQIIAAAVVTVLVLMLIVIFAVHHRHTSGQGSLPLKSASDESEPLVHSSLSSNTGTETSSSGLSGGYEVEDIAVSDNEMTGTSSLTNATSKASPVTERLTSAISSQGAKADITVDQTPLQHQLAQAPSHVLHVAPGLQPVSTVTSSSETAFQTAPVPS